MELRTTVESWWSSVAQHWRRAAARAFAVLGVAWTFIEVVDFFDEDDAISRTKLGIVVGAIGIVAWITWTIPRRRLTLVAPTGEIELRFGDIFASDAVKIVGVNDCFDTTDEDVIAPGSVHGQLINVHLNGDTARFRQLVDDALLGVRSESVRRDGSRNPRRYPIGTTATINLAGHTYVLVAVGYTNLDDDRVSTTVEQYVAAISAALSAARGIANGRDVAMPFVGSGIAGVSATPQQLLTLLVLLVAEAERRQQVAKTVTVLLDVRVRDRVDLDALSGTLE